MKNTHGGALILDKKACNFTRSEIPPWVFFKFLKIVQIVQSI